VQAWVPTGATTSAPRTRKANVPLRVAVLVRTWFLVGQLLFWTGVVHALPYAGALTLLPAIALGLIQVYMLAPYLIRLNPRPRPAAAHYEGPML